MSSLRQAWEPPSPAVFLASHARRVKAKSRGLDSDSSPWGCPERPSPAGPPRRRGFRHQVLEATVVACCARVLILPRWWRCYVDPGVRGYPHIRLSIFALSPRDLAPGVHIDRKVDHGLGEELGGLIMLFDANSGW